jgi:hypothetical protein
MTPRASATIEAETTPAGFQPPALPVQNPIITSVSPSHTAPVGAVAAPRSRRHGQTNAQFPLGASVSRRVVVRPPASALAVMTP